MRKKYILIIILIVILVGLLIWRMTKKSAPSIILFKEAKMVEGVVSENRKNSIIVQTKTPNPDAISQGNKDIEENFEFYFDSKSEILKAVADLKTEEEFKQEELDFSVWRNKADSEKGIFDYMFTPSWNKNIIQSVSDLKAGDEVRVIYYTEGKKNIAVKILNKFVDNKIYDENNASAKISVISFLANILEIGDNFLSVKTTNSVNDKYPEGATVKVLINDKTIIQNKTTKSETDFRVEEKKFNDERAKIKKEGGDIFKVQAPSWFVFKDISPKDLKIGSSINLEVVEDNGNFLANKIQQIIK